VFGFQPIPLETDPSGVDPPDPPACSLIDIAGYGGNGTSHDVNYPASISAGDILALAIAYVQEAPSGLSGWTALRSTTLNGSGATGTIATYYKVATGSEGSTFNLTTSVTTKLAAIVTSLTCDPASSGSTNYGNSDTAAPSAPSPSIGSDVFQMVCVAWIDGRRVSTYPAGYDGLTGDGGSGHGVSDITLNVGWSDYARPTEAPGNIDIESVNPWATIVEVFG
jgi:hypothetical protein